MGNKEKSSVADYNTILDYRCPDRIMLMISQLIQTDKIGSIILSHSKIKVDNSRSLFKLI